MSDDSVIGEFLVAHGGPFFELQKRLGLLHNESMRGGARAIGFVALAWGVPFLLSFAAGDAFGPVAEDPYLLDLGAWSRFFVAVGLFVLMERHVEDRLRKALAQFVRAPLIAPESIAAAAGIVSNAVRQRDSCIAEGLCVAAAILLTVTSMLNTLHATASSWAIHVAAEGHTFTPAGLWCLFVSLPVFWFLLLRSLWRHLVWTMLLRRLAGLKLRLVTTHPDGKGGLAFIGQYPNAYTIFIFAVSCVIGATLAHQLIDNLISPATYGSVMGGWLAIVLMLFAYPLLAFRKPLSELKEKTLLICGAQASRYHRLAERKLLSRNIVAEDAAESKDIVEVSDPSKQFDVTRKLSVLLVSRSALLPVSAAAILPLAAAGLTELPFKEMLTIVKRLLLL